MTEEERFMKEAIRQAKKSPGFEGGSHRMRDRVRGKDHCQSTTGEIQIKILFPMRS